MRRVAIVACLLLLASGCRVAWQELASRDLGGDGANGDSLSPALSADGRYVAFSSDADDLVPGDTNGETDVFVRDLQTGAVELISVGEGGVPANGESIWPSISADGMRVSFYSTASNLAPDVPSRGDVFVRDRASQTTVSASLGFTGFDQTGIGLGAISGDGSKVWFPASARIAQFVLHGFGVFDVDTATLSLTNSPAIFPVFQDGLMHGAVSHDGRYAAISTFTLPAPEVTIEVWRVDRVTNTAQPITGIDGFTPASPCTTPSISGDGSQVVFTCSTDTVMAGAPSEQNVYVRDMDTGVTTLVSVDGGGLPAGGGTFPSISDDGNRVAFVSGSSSVVPNDNNGVSDVFVRDLDAGTTTRVSLNADGNEVGGIHNRPSLGDGEFVAFSSNSNDIVPGDADGTFDVVVRSVDTPLLVSASPAVLAPGTTEVVDVTGAYFQPDVIVEVSPGGVTVDDVVFVSPTQLQVILTVDPSAEPGLRQLGVTVPGPGPGIYNRTGSTDHCKCISVS